MNDAPRTPDGPPADDPPATPRAQKRDDGQEAFVPIGIVFITLGVVFLMTNDGMGPVAWTFIPVGFTFLVLGLSAVSSKRSRRDEIESGP